MVKEHLRQVVGLYVLEAFYTAFQEICRDDYDFLQKLYDVPNLIKTPASHEAAPQAAPDAKEEEIPRPKNLRDVKVRIVKKDSPESKQTPFTQEPAPPAPAPPAPPAPAPAPAPPAPAPGETQSPHGLTDPKDIKRWQKEQEDIKKRELDAKGINPASLLTKENLQKWIIDEKKTFAAVARDYVGLPDSMVSSAAKSYGIQSETSKRRALIAASKRK